MAELISSLAAGKDACATVVRVSCPDSDGPIRFPKIPPFFQHGSGCLSLLRGKFAEGLAKGVAKGKAETLLETAAGMQAAGIAAEIIARITGLPLERIAQATLRELKQSGNSPQCHQCDSVQSAVPLPRFLATPGLVHCPPSNATGAPEFTKQNHSTLPQIHMRLDFKRMRKITACQAD